eukprot:5355540-Pyramimonas_sp.AAC.1
MTAVVAKQILGLCMTYIKLIFKCPTWIDKAGNSCKWDPPTCPDLCLSMSRSGRLQPTRIIGQAA